MAPITFHEVLLSFLRLFLRNSFHVLERVSFCYITIYILVFKTFYWTS